MCPPFLNVTLVHSECKCERTFSIFIVSSFAHSRSVCVSVLRCYTNKSLKRQFIQLWNAPSTHLALPLCPPLSLACSVRAAWIKNIFRGGGRERASESDPLEAKHSSKALIGLIMALCCFHFIHFNYNKTHAHTPKLYVVSVFFSSRQLYNPIDFNEVDHTKKEGERKNRSELKRIKTHFIVIIITVVSRLLA